MSNISDAYTRARIDSYNFREFEGELKDLIRRVAEAGDMDEVIAARLMEVDANNLDILASITALIEEGDLDTAVIARAVDLGYKEAES